MAQRERGIRTFSHTFRKVRTFQVSALQPWRRRGGPAWTQIGRRQCGRWSWTWRTRVDVDCPDSLTEIIHNVFAFLLATQRRRWRAKWVRKQTGRVLYGRWRLDLAGRRSVSAAVGTSLTVPIMSQAAERTGVAALEAARRVGMDIKGQEAVRPLEFIDGGLAQRERSSAKTSDSIQHEASDCVGVAAAEAARRVGMDTKRLEAVRPLELDVADPRSVSAAVAAVQHEYDQRIACLVNNGGAQPLTFLDMQNQK